MSSLAVRARNLLSEFGADPELINQRGLPLFEDAKNLVVAEVGTNNRQHQLTPDAAAQWLALKQAAERDGIHLYVVSAFRSFARQQQLVQAALDRAASATQVFTTIAPPGCSEHHSGCAVDIGTPNFVDVSESFAESPAFNWLQQQGHSFGFSLSFPPQNPWGYAYEPWHWCWHR